MANNILEDFRRRIADAELGSLDFRWVGPTEAPSSDTGDAVVVLEPTFRNLEETARFAWTWSQTKFARSFTSLHPGNLRLRAGATFQPLTLSWWRIRLDTYREQIPAAVLEAVPGEWPGLAILFVAAEHPDRVRAGRRRFGDQWLAGGLEYSTPECNLPPSRRQQPPQELPAISYDGAFPDQIIWGSRELTEHLSNFTIPAYV